MSSKKFIIACGAAALTLLGPVAIADAAVTPHTAKLAAPCRDVHGTKLPRDNARIHLWLCDDGWHGQITDSPAGGEIEMVSKFGTPYGKAYVRAGQTSQNSGTVGQYGGPWKACGGVGDDRACTYEN